ncbi:cystathione beta-lyase [Salinihabitans flavidus]|uniref:cysteine-S-conjugate beta-lyase n=1 Tax=Salinihabitans flavidus TaxID=569882 RepID=A0A1H8QT42_9RHOB|nr:PatB family C-S lyase [Salinihabitans flavidus]SEO57003.1 cystathione beta-lyase [Salinihabitans flavidus]
MNFDEIIDRRGTDSAKWDMMERAFGVPPEDGIAMWVADMDFRAPDFLQDAVQRLLETANYGYFSGMETFHEAVQWWMKTRHNWRIESDWIFVTHGLGNGIAMTLQALTAPGDRIVTFTPVYHEFQAKIERNGRVNTQLPLRLRENGTYDMDFDAYEAMMTGKEKVALISAPHNPAGRVWTRDELEALADFCLRHDLILISDEIHHDLVLPGYSHLNAHVALPQIADRLVVMTAASKTFNIAGARTGCVIIPDDALQERFAKFFRQFDISPNLLGVDLTRAAYSPAGADWVDALNIYLDGNYRAFKDGVDAIPGLTAMPMEATYLAWVDFAGTGMAREEFQDRIYKDARIAATPGQTLGRGGESFMRFNLGTPRARVEEAVARLSAAFGDLQ